MSKRLSSRAIDTSPKTKSIKEIDFKSWQIIYKDDFSNQMIDRKQDFVNLQDL